MTDDAHDMGLMTFIIDGVAHGLAVYGEAFVVLPIGSVPALKCAVEMHGIDADEDIPDDVLARDNAAAVFAAAAEALPGLLAKAFGPIRDGLVSAHPAQACPGGNGENRTEAMPSTLGAAGIRDTCKE